MYQIKCNNHPLLDLRDERLIVLNPRVQLEVNKVGGASFTIYKTHPFFDQMTPKSIFEIADEIGVIFRGRMTGDTLDFDNGKAVDLEGAMAFFNDSMVRPFTFPDDFLSKADYVEASENGNVVEYFLKWLIDNHNSQVQEWQQLKLGNVTVEDKNNYLTRSSTDYKSTWATLEEKLFNSSLGGYLCIRYEDDGNYIDYLSEFELTNTQAIEYGKNMLDLSNETNLSEVYSAIIPIGAEMDINTGENYEGDYVEIQETVRERLTLKYEDDKDINDDIVKSGDTLYSRKAVAAYGWKYAPTEITTWDDVTTVENLLDKGVAFFETGAFPTSTIEIRAVDLHFTDEQIRSFRIYRNVRAISKPHNLVDIYMLSKLDIPLMQPQNTEITVGKIQTSLTGANKHQETNTANRIESTEKNIAENRKNITIVSNQVVEQHTTIINDCEKIILSALERYVETSNYDEFKKTVESELLVLAGQISMNFTTTTEQIENVDGDLQSKFEQVYKHISFSENGISIGSGDSNITLEIDNDIISFKKNGQQFGWWDGLNFHTGNIVVKVKERAQFGNFAFIPRSDGSLMFAKVGD